MRELPLSDERRSGYDPSRNEDVDSDIGLDVGTGTTMRGLLKDAVEEQSLPAPRGPILSLYAGLAGAESELLSLLPDDSQRRIIAIDYNPNLADGDRISYRTGDVINVLPTLEKNSFGIITVFGADGSIKKGDWDIIWRQASEVLRVGGYVLIVPNYNSYEMPNNFSIISNGFRYLIAMKK